MEKEVLLLHIKAKYLITVEKQLFGCKITYPANYFIQPNLDIITEEYKFIDNKLVISSDGRDREIEVFGYDNRMLIMTNLLFKQNKYNLSNHLVLYFDGLQRKTGLLDILPTPKGELAKKEKIIQRNYLEILDLLFTPKDAKENDILDGYNNITNLIAKGEL